ncbi:hypothetical protein HY495_01375 [Candidatus Woesearchaeota archaeon]|nr:hypothetical protein [Candidatus Woesearchaeota archaeon]
MTIISGTRTPEQILREHFEREVTARRFATEEEERRRRNPGAGSGAGVGAGNPPPPPLRALNAGDYIKLENIVCVDADGVEFEKYPQLYVSRDIFRESNGQQKNYTPHNAAVYCEQNGLFLPSFALTCNYLAALFSMAVEKKTDGSYKMKDATAKALLDQYKDKGNGNGYHAQNTIVDFSDQTIIHYPTPADFGQTNAVNAAHPRISKTFVKVTLQDSVLETALQDQAHLRYVKQLTGLRDPLVLVEIGNYFGKPAKLWFPWNGQNGASYMGKRAAWLGCNGYNFILDADGILNYSGAARGVRR